MDYNLANWIRVNTGVDIKVNGTPVNETGQSIVLNSNGGSVAPRELRDDYRIQIISKAASSVIAKQEIETVYEYLKNRYNITLPEVEVNSKIYPTVVVAQMSPIQSPGYLGTDENGLHKWTVNFKVIV